MCSQQIGSNRVMLSCQYGPKSLKNISDACATKNRGGSVTGVLVPEAVAGDVFVIWGMAGNLEIYHSQLFWMNTEIMRTTAVL